MSKVHVKTGDTVILLTGKYEDKYEKNGDRKTGKSPGTLPLRCICGPGHRRTEAGYIAAGDR